MIWHNTISCRRRYFPSWFTASFYGGVSSLPAYLLCYSRTMLVAFKRGLYIFLYSFIDEQYFQVLRGHIFIISAALSRLRTTHEITR